MWLWTSIQPLYDHLMLAGNIRNCFPRDVSWKEQEDDAHVDSSDYSEDVQDYEGWGSEDEFDNGIDSLGAMLDILGPEDFSLFVGGHIHDD